MSHKMLRSFIVKFSVLGYFPLQPYIDTYYVYIIIVLDESDQLHYKCL